MTGSASSGHAAPQSRDPYLRSLCYGPRLRGAPRRYAAQRTASGARANASLSAALPPAPPESAPTNECPCGNSSRVPDAVQRSPGDAKHRPVTLLRRAGTHTCGPYVMGPGSAEHHAATRRSAPRPGHERTRASARRMDRALAKSITLQNHVMGIAALHHPTGYSSCSRNSSWCDGERKADCALANPPYKLCFASRASTISRPSRDKTTRRANHPNPVQPL
jgi:hypothetical protein